MGRNVFPMGFVEFLAFLGNPWVYYSIHLAPVEGSEKWHLNKMGEKPRKVSYLCAGNRKGAELPPLECGN